MQTDWKTPFARQARGRGYVHEPTGTSLRGITASIKAAFYPHYELDKATAGAGRALATSSSSGLRLYGRQTALSAGMKRGLRVGNEMQQVHKVCLERKMSLFMFFKHAVVHQTYKLKQRGAGVIQSKKKSRSKAALAARAAVPLQAVLNPETGKVDPVPPRRVQTLMQKLSPLTVRLIQFLLERKWCVAAVELAVGNVKMGRATGIDLLLYSPEHKAYLPTELKTGYGKGAHDRHTPGAKGVIGFPYGKMVDSPRNTIQLQVLMNDTLFRDTFPDVKVLHSQELLVSADPHQQPQLFPLEDWAVAKRSEFLGVLSKH